MSGSDFNFLYWDDYEKKPLEPSTEKTDSEGEKDEGYKTWVTTYNDTSGIYHGDVYDDQDEDPDQ